MDQRFERHNYGLVSEGVDINNNEGINDDRVEEEHEINNVLVMVKVKNMEDRISKKKIKKIIIKKNKCKNRIPYFAADKTLFFNFFFPIKFLQKSPCIL